MSRADAHTGFVLALAAFEFVMLIWFVLSSSRQLREQRERERAALAASPAVFRIAGGVTPVTREEIARMMADHAVWWTAEDKALALLKSWLSPEQLEQYELFSAFDVTGSDTGKRYRIRHGKAQNVYELDGNGNAISGLCFSPGQLPAGDCMLAQKIALETRESEALAVANRFGVFGAGAREATARQLIYLGFEFRAGRGVLADNVSS